MTLPWNLPSWYVSLVATAIIPQHVSAPNFSYGWGIKSPKGYVTTPRSPRKSAAE